ncbi:hypothetical protein DH86_00000425 [Scytalidium sp. 3C]|nr:hypothetical protein DH86_00000425 [Scytalidium sp. 3C]
MSSPAFQHFAGAQTNFKPPLIANENAYLGDVVSSTDGDKPISAGFYRLEKGTPLVYTYHYHEMKIIVDGEFDISDETGQKVHAVKGDVFYFPAGSKITFTTETFGLGFYVGQRKEWGRSGIFLPVLYQSINQSVKASDIHWSGRGLMSLQAESIIYQLNTKSMNQSSHVLFCPTSRYASNLTVQTHVRGILRKEWKGSPPLKQSYASYY